MSGRDTASQVGSTPGPRSWARRALTVVASTVVALGGLAAAPAQASSVTSAVFSGTTGTASVGGTLYAKQGAALTLTVVTSSDTKCVDVTGAATLPRQTSSSAKSNWSFTTTAAAGNGVQAFTVAASPNFNNNNNCTGQTNSTQASYTLDNTGPVVSGALTPTPNAAGWNNTDVVVRWTAADAGSGVAAAQPFQTDSAITANGIVTRTAAAQSDRLGNTGATGAVTVRVDKSKPSITAVQTKNADGTTTVTFTCDDSNSGGGEASGIASCLADGSTTNARAVQPGVTVTGTATDRAGNTNNASSTAPAADTTAPILSGAPTTSANDNGWYQGDVSIDWTASDPESGIPTPPADTTITGEGTGLTSSQTVQNGAGLSTTATSPAVRIDRTAPTTGISGTSNNWINGSVNVTLTPTDNLSGVASTSYSINGGAAQSGTTFSLSSEGDHTVSFFSTDNAGNAEAAQTVQVKIDKTAPSITKAFTPSTYTDGAWTNQNVTVTFTCADQGGSGLASCTAPVTTSTEGEGQQVTGTGTDNAGNSATSTALVSIDKTAPKVIASVDRGANGAGWYNNDVTVSFAATDALSGVATRSANVVLGQGANQSATGSATDTAGNSASDGVSGINVDKAAPTLSGTFPAGWSTGNVSVSWTCTDTGGSGVKGAQPADTIVEGEGDNLSATASCEDVAGNTVTKTVTGIKIDRSKPTTQATVAAPNDNGWYGGAVQVTLNASDNLSGITATKYSVDGGAAQDYTGAFSFGTEGTHEITFWSKDGAGNAETAGAPIILKIDKTAPATTVTVPSTDSGWYVTSGIPVAFKTVDGGSGIAATYYTIDGGERQTYGEPFTAALSTGTHTITYWSVDLAGNEEVKASTNTVELKVDTIAPAIKGTRTPAANSFGWNNTDVDVTFECSDADSGLDGVVGCGPNQKVSSEGANQNVQGDAQDIAGNKSSTTVSDINIDKTLPSLVGAATTAANGAGWYNGDVSIRWTGDDGLSGIDPATQPADSTITGEGTNLGASASIKDKAGNARSASVSGIKIDRTAPAVAGRATTAANAAGWYKDSVTVDFTCTDTLSGVASCPTSKVLSGNGANQSVTSEPASDRAGNGSAGKTVGGINIDGTAPTTTSNNQCTKANGYCTGSTANVVLASTDQAWLSGVKEIRYQVDGGTVQVAAGSTKTVNVPLDGSGAGTIDYWAVDNAGNVESKNSVALKWDNIAPTVSHTLTPAPNALDWNKDDVTVTFTAKDDDAGSGVASVTAPVTVSTETAGQAVNGSATDTAGNTGTDTVTVKLDKTAPTITGAITAGTKGNNGWYTGAVTVTFTCSDGLSGVATCPDPVILTENGTNSIERTATDKAGNSATATVSGINIDKTAPVIGDVNVAGGFYTLGGTPKATCTATDTFSGLAGDCSVTVTGGTANGVGTFSWTATAVDNAGNKGTQTGTYKVVYKFTGFLQPINDTAHQTGLTTSVFKAGSTIPVKFQLRNAAGLPVQSATAPTWLTPVMGAKMSMPVDETAVTVTADSGSTFRYDATAQQYIYNWKTPSTGGNYHQIGVRLDDGQVYYVNIGLR